MAGRSEEAERTISELTIKVNELQMVVGEAMAAKDEITDLLDPKGGVARVRTQVDDLMKDISRLQVRSNDFAKLGGAIGPITEQMRELEEEQESVTRSVESVSKRLGEADVKVSELGEGFQAVSVLRQEIEDLSGPKGPLARVRAQVEQAREESLGYGQEVAQLSEDQAVVRAAQEGVVASYEDLRTKMESLDAGVDKANASVAHVDKAMVDLTKAEEIGARTERQLRGLQTLSDHITGKVAGGAAARGDGPHRSPGSGADRPPLGTRGQAEGSPGADQRGEEGTFECREPPRHECQGGGADG